jgi:C-3',4' desaturase CrtD
MLVQNPVHFFKSSPSTQLFDEYDVIVVGGGLAGLTTAALCAKKGKRMLLLERNYIPGGCASSYYRNGAVFDTGATTLLGLSEGMPLRIVLDELGIELPAKQLKVPMLVHLSSGEALARYENKEAWIAEAERIFGVKNQRKFWEHCFKLSDFVWESAMRFRHFPPVNLQDLLSLARNVRFTDVGFLKYTFQTVEQWIKACNLDDNSSFRQFIDQQLLITAQNNSQQVNLLFGAAALCYTNYPNYTLPGGMVTLVKSLTDSIASNGGHVLYRTEVQKITRSNNKSWEIRSGDLVFKSRDLVSAIPLHNFNSLIDSSIGKIKIVEGNRLSSALQFNATLRHWGGADVLHNQVHTKDGSSSVFFSVSECSDRMRANEGLRVLSATTHAHLVGDVEVDKNKWAQQVIELAENRNLFRRDDLVEYHVSDASNWQQWTGRYRGFVGGIPQFKHIKPWMMNRQQKGDNLFFCGDSVYPGQGIPGVVLSGWQVANRILRK